MLHTHLATTKVVALFVIHTDYRILFQFCVARTIACFFWRSYGLLTDKSGGNTPQAASGENLVVERGIAGRAGEDHRPKHSATRPPPAGPPEAHSEVFVPQAQAA
jgi:hypothetical protein